VKTDNGWTMNPDELGTEEAVANAESRSAWLRPTLIAMAVDTVGVMPIFLTGAMAVQLETDVGLDVRTLGFVYASYFAAAAAMSTPVGRLSEKTGPALALRVGTVLSILSLVGIGILVDTPWKLTSFLVLAGLGTSLTRTASSVLVARAVTPGRQGLAFGLKNSSIPAGALIAGLAVPLVALPFGWRWAFAISAGVSLGAIAVIPRHVSRPARKEPHLRADLPLRVLGLAALSFALGASAASSLGAFTVVTAVGAGMRQGEAGILVAVGSVIGLLVRLLAGRWSDDRKGSQLDIVSAMLTLGGLGYILIAFSGPGLLWLAVPLAYGTGWAFFGSFNLAIVRLNPNAPGAAVGVTQTGAFAGSIIGPITLGLLANQFSFEAAWLAAAAAGVAAGVIVFVIREFILREPARRQLSPGPLGAG